MNGQEYDPVEILQIEMTMRIILNDALGRYIHDPTNLLRIMDTLRGTLAGLREIQTDQALKCPAGYVHQNCACVPHIQDPFLK